MEYNKKTALPDYPKANIRGNSIIIIEENGDEYLWGYEEQIPIRMETAKDIELNLKAIKYVKNNLINSINDIMFKLIDENIPIEYLDKIIYEAYVEINEYFNELNKNKKFLFEFY